MLISFKNALLIFLFTLIIFRSVTIACYSENCAFILNLVQYIFTCVFKFCFHAYFFIRDCNTFGGNMIPYVTAKGPLIPLIRSVFSRPLRSITHNLCARVHKVVALQSTISLN